MQKIFKWMLNTYKKDKETVMKKNEILSLIGMIVIIILLLYSIRLQSQILRDLANDINYLSEKIDMLTSYVKMQAR